MANPYWAVADVVVRTPRIELRIPTDDELIALARLAGEGIHDPGWMPLMGWTDQPSPQLERGVLYWHWGRRGDWMPTSWNYNPVALVDGEVVGTQGLYATEFARLRVVNTGSWLGRRFQGLGLGKEMRSAILHLAFAGLDALEARSGFWHDNEPSRRVSEGLGYEAVGERWVLRRDARDREIEVRLRREVWEARRRDDIELVGVDGPTLELFGAATPPG
ncbi:MAG TPA: GNAT family protein [Acidimicrobiales bacterium]|nr:GNAT family protein [Acidimicrobiales bacterium]